ncbi:MAG: hypothetical protein L0Z50_34320 [Verrucomicrobiales bacterium]|nr:hypothetical protein [Verrucomicrobiales bacterium]
MIQTKRTATPLTLTLSPLRGEGNPLTIVALRPFPAFIALRRPTPWPEHDEPLSN